MSRRAISYRFLLLPLVLGAVVLAFALGRATAPEVVASSAPDCSGYERTGIDTPETFAGPERPAYFSMCEYRAAQPGILGEPWGKIKIYESTTGDDVIAWWYLNCGTPEGIVAIGAERPTNCGSTDTTGPP